MSKPEAPTPPSPYATASAQTGANVSTSVANAFLNNTNQNTPDGSLSYDVTGTHSWQDPTTGATYNIPRFTSTQTLNPQGQAIRDQGDAARYNMAGTANALSGNLAAGLSQGIDTSGAPAMGNTDLLYGGDARNSFDAGGDVQRTLGDYGQQQSTFGDAGDITRDYGPADNFSADRQRVEAALYERMNPQLQQDEGRLRQQLQDQGIRYGSEAYNQAMLDQSRRVNDARLGITAAGGAEQQRMNAMAAQRAAFQNSAQGQAYQQALGRGEFGNKAQQQNYQQGLGAGAFANQAQAQQFSQNSMQAQFANQALMQNNAARQAQYNAQQGQRSQWLNEEYAQRNQGLNEMNALQSGGSVNNPSFSPRTNDAMPTTDIAGLMNTSYNQQMAAYQQQSQSYNDTIGGVLGLGAGILMSDERTKKNIKRVGTVLATKRDEDVPKMATVFGAGGSKAELPIYEYSYKQDPASTRHVGPMAQDVEKVDPKAVLHDKRGTKYIDKARVMGNILRAA